MVLRKKKTFFLVLKLKTKETLDFWSERYIFNNAGEGLVLVVCLGFFHLYFGVFFPEMTEQ